MYVARFDTSESMWEIVRAVDCSICMRTRVLLVYTYGWSTTILFNFFKQAMKDNASQGESLLNSRDGCVKGGTHESDARGQLFEPISESNVEPSSLNLWLGIADTRMQ